MASKVKRRSASPRRRYGESPAGHGFQLIQAAGLARRQADQGYNEAVKGECHVALMHIIKAREAFSEAETHAMSGARDEASLTAAKTTIRASMIAFGRSCVVKRRGT